MATRSTQYLCPLCRVPTLHVQNTEEPPHVVHALMSLFCCGFWVPIWAVHSLVAASQANRTPYRCSRCGNPSVLPGGAIPAASHLPRATPLPAARQQPLPTATPAGPSFSSRVADTTHRVTQPLLTTTEHGMPAWLKLLLFGAACWLISVAVLMALFVR